MTARAWVAGILATLAVVGPAQAMELGVQDDGRLRHDPGAVYQAGHELGARWLRIIIVPGDPQAANKIRSAHARGFSVLLTIGGTGTRLMRPSARTLLATIRRLPRADRYTVINEPDLSGLPACRYRAVWTRVRRVLGNRLLWGDFSPAAPLRYTQAARRCGRIPTRLAFALHPYQSTDPLRPPAESYWSEGGIGNLRRNTTWLRRHLGLRVEWWLDEFAYLYGPDNGVTDEQAAAMWPRAMLAARRVGARMLGVYMPAGPTWDSRPRALAWCVLARRCEPPTLGSVPPSRVGEAVPAYGVY